MAEGNQEEEQGAGSPIAGLGRIGRVCLVGAGPGDPELLTLKAARLLASADAVVYDNLVGPGILGMASPKAELHYVGKVSNRHTLPQTEINALLVRLARQGLQVVRLKGGDPYIFGRGGEEAEDLVAAGIPFETVPGITAAAGMAASTGIPLTHRSCAQILTFATGHLKDDSCDLDWMALARPGQTLVFYMGVKGLEEITRRLEAHGLRANTPAALVQHATLPGQRVVVGTLGSLSDLAHCHGIRPPALIVIGEVVSLQSRLGPGIAEQHEISTEPEVVLA